MCSGRWLRSSVFPALLTFGVQPLVFLVTSKGHSRETKAADSVAVFIHNFEEEIHHTKTGNNWGESFPDRQRDIVESGEDSGASVRGKTAWEEQTDKNSGSGLWDQDWDLVGPPLTLWSHVRAVTC